MKPVKHQKGRRTVNRQEQALFDSLNDFYQNQDEDKRLLSQSGRVEYETTMRYVTRTLTPRYAHFRNRGRGGPLFPRAGPNGL